MKPQRIQLSRKAIKERPILYSGPMVRAVMTCAKCGHVSVPVPCEKCGADEWVKTHTRRVVKPQPTSANREALYLVQEFTDKPHREIDCPYGQPGDRLWVRETFCNAALPGYQHVYLYRADEDTKPDSVHWRPSIFMPRRLSRILLEVVSVRVERLQEISEADAIAEGLPPNAAGLWLFPQPGGPKLACDSARAAYQVLWGTINGPGSWEENPCVWVVVFKRIGGEA